MPPDCEAPHRHGIWRLDRTEQVSDLMFSSNPVSLYLVRTISDWLAGRAED